MGDFFLKFDDAAAAAAALSADGMDGKPDGSWALDHVGAVWTQDVLDEAGNVVTPAAPVAGYHVNVRLLTGSLPESLTAFEVFPAAPYRRFAQ